MNSLNARVSSVRTQENPKKNAELRYALAKVPKQYENSTEEFCLLFKRATTVQNQVNVVNELFRLIYVNLDVQRFLVRLFYQTPLKHPLRNQLKKIFLRAPDLWPDGKTQKTITWMFAYTMNEMIINIERDSNAWNDVIASIYDSMDKIPYVETAVGTILSTLIDFLVDSVSFYLHNLRNLNLPSQFNEYFMYLMNTGYCFLYIVKRCKIVDQKSIDALENVKNIFLTEIVGNSDYPMDLRVLLTQFIAKLFQSKNSLHEFFAITLSTRSSTESYLFYCVSLQVLTKEEVLDNIDDVHAIAENVVEMIVSVIKRPHEILCGARSLQHLSKVILLAVRGMQDTSKYKERIGEILFKLLIFIFNCVEHYMDTVRHLCRETLEYTINAAKKTCNRDIIKEIYDRCDDASITAKTIFLHQLTLANGSEEVLISYPELFTDLFANHLGKEPAVNNLYEVMIVSSHKTYPTTEWVDIWLDYLIGIVSPSTPDNILLVVENLLQKAVELEPNLVTGFISEEDLPMRTKLSLLWLVRKKGLEVAKNFDSLMNNFHADMEASIISSNDDLRIMALRVLVETHKTTAPITQLEHVNILKYTDYTLNSQSPDTRQKSLALLSKFLKRCEVNLLKVLKKQNTLTAQEAQEEPLPLKFFNGFIHLLIGNLFEGANFSRRSLSLQLLKQCVEIGINCDLSLEELLSERAIFRLVMMLKDSYESNNELAVSILKMLDDRWEHQLANKCVIMLTQTHFSEQLRSLRPTDSVACAYALEFWCNANKTLSFIETACPLPQYCPSYYAALKWLLKLLKEDLKVATKSILEAAKRGPLYGILFVIRHLLSRLMLHILAEDINWRIFIADLIVCCREATLAVAPIVNNTSPEGHLPNDFSALTPMLAKIQINDSTTEEEAGMVDNDSASKSNCKILSAVPTQRINLDNLRTTPQMVLLCGWRTIKEVSLLLGNIVLYAPVKDCSHSELQGNFLLTKEQVLEIGEHFKILLSETKHRGAFEQAYVGFSKLATRLWRIASTELSAFPMMWLLELHVLILGKQENVKKKLCATRRSAGLPFMIQALITSERQLGTNKALQCSMKALFAACKDRHDDNSESRMHALNILRALFRCTDLKEDVEPYVEEGVMVAILSYKEKTWAEKNAATLLYAALIVRIFGVQREKDLYELNVRNKMTGRIFFQRYPKLYDFFLKELKSASAAVRENRRADELKPLLMILSRLYPSALEGTESTFMLSEFIFPIYDCIASPQFGIRQLAAEAIVALHSKDTLLGITMFIQCHTDYMTKPISANRLHGQMLLVNKIQKSVDLSPDENISIIMSIHAMQDIMLRNNLVIQKAMFDILVSCLEKIPPFDWSYKIYTCLCNLSNIENTMSKSDIGYYPVLWSTYTLFKLHFIRLTNTRNLLAAYLQDLIKPEPQLYVERTMVGLQIISGILLDDQDISKMFEVDLIAGVEKFIMLMEPKSKIYLKTQFSQSKFVQEMLQQLLQWEILHPQGFIFVYAILSALDYFDFTLDQLLEETEKYSSDIQAAVAMCMERFVKQNTLKCIESQEFLEYIFKIAQPWQPHNLRCRAAAMLEQLSPHYENALKKQTLSFVTVYIKLMLLLLMDDDADIRERTMQIVLKNMLNAESIKDTVPTMAQRLFLQLTADILLKMEASIEYIGDIMSIILSIAKENNDDPQHGEEQDSGDLEVFSKNETNVFAEPLTPVADAFVIFSETFKHREEVFNLINTHHMNLNALKFMPEPFQTLLFIEVCK